MTVRTLVAEEAGACLERFAPDFRGDGRLEDAERVIAAEEAGACLGAVRLVRRAVWLSGRRVRACGLRGPVVCDFAPAPAVRQALMRAAIRDMEASGEPVSFLFSGESDWLAQCGWQPVERRLLLFAPGAPPAGLTMRPVQEEDWGAIRGLYSLFSGEYSGTVVRESEEYWRRCVLPKLTGVRVARREERIVGYIAAARDSGVLCVQECAVHPDWNDLNGMIALAAEGAARVLLPAPLAPGVSGEMRRAGTFMARLNRPFWLGSERIGDGQAFARSLRDCVFWPADEF